MERNLLVCVCLLAYSQNIPNILITPLRLFFVFSPAITKYVSRIRIPSHLLDTISSE